MLKLQRKETLKRILFEMQHCGSSLLSCAEKIKIDEIYLIEYEATHTDQCIGIKKIVPIARSLMKLRETFGDDQKRLFGLFLISTPISG